MGLLLNINRQRFVQRHSLYVLVNTSHNNSFLALTNVFGAFLTKGSVGLVNFDPKKYRSKATPKPKKRKRDIKEEVVIRRSDHYTADFKEAARSSKKYIEEFCMAYSLLMKKGIVLPELSPEYEIKWEEFISAKELKHRQYKANPSKSRGFLNRSNSMLQQLAFQLFTSFHGKYNQRLRRKKFYKYLTIQVNTLNQR